MMFLNMKKEAKTFSTFFKKETHLYSKDTDKVYFTQNKKKQFVSRSNFFLPFCSKICSSSLFSIGPLHLSVQFFFKS